MSMTYLHVWNTKLSFRWNSVSNIFHLIWKKRKTIFLFFTWQVVPEVALAHAEHRRETDRLEQQRDAAHSDGGGPDDPGVADGWYLVGTPKNGFPCLAQRGFHALRYLAGFKKALEAYRGECGHLQYTQLRTRKRLSSTSMVSAARRTKTAGPRTRGFVFEFFLSKWLDGGCVKITSTLIHS